MNNRQKQITKDDKKSAAKSEQDGIVQDILRAHSIRQEFGLKALNEAKDAHSCHTLEGRRSFIDDLIVTIDGADAKDLDDAIALRQEDGKYILGVHIADVSHYVREKSALDKEAMARGTSVYFGQSVVPMLPKELSNELCSLHPQTDKLTLSLIITLDEDANVISSELCEGVINTNSRLTYDFVQSVLDGGECNSDLKQMLLLAQTLAQKLIKKREKEGSIDFELPECSFSFSDEGKVEDIFVKPRLFSHRLIEEFMLLANQVVAKQYLDKKTPFIFRVHEAPDTEKLGALAQFIEPLGLRLKLNKTGEATSRAMANLLKDAAKTDYAAAVSRVALRSMQKAYYSPINRKHFGLAFKHYCHFTSPIRRYPDLAIHRIIKSELNNGASFCSKYKAFSAIAAQIGSETEREAMVAEREIEAHYKALYFEDKIGQEFEGTISGVMQFGVFVELGNTAEGLVFCENLPNDYYVFDAPNHTLRGRRHSYRLGDKLLIAIRAVNSQTGKLEFSATDEQASKKRAPSKQRPQKKRAKKGLGGKRKAKKGKKRR